MNKQKLLIFALVITAFLFHTTKNIYAVELITNGGFETSTLAGWTVANTLCPDNGSSYNPWASRGPGTSFGNGPVTSPLFGTFDASHGWACGPTLAANTYYVPEATITMYQNVTVPAGNNLTAKFSEKLWSNLQFFGISDYRSVRPQFYRVEIRNTSNTILQTLFTATAPGSTITNIPWTSHTIDLGNTYAGQTIRLAFVFSVATGLAGPGVAEIDGVSMDASIPTAANVAVGGRVLTNTGTGISRSNVTLTDGAGNIRTATTNLLGYYKFEEVQAGATYILTVSNKKYLFTNSPRVITVQDNLADVDFVASP